MSTAMMEAAMDLGELRRICSARWGVDLLVPEEAQERMRDLEVSMESVLAGIDDLLSDSGYGGRVLEIDIRHFEDGPIPAAAVSMSWVDHGL